MRALLPAALLTAAAWAGPALAAPSASQQAVYKALSVRHDAPDCAAIDTLTDVPAQDLAYLVEHAKQPAWVGMRAAECLLERFPTEARPLARQWVTHEQHRGFALLTLGALDRLPPGLAVELAQLSRVGPLADVATPRIAKAKTPEVAAVAAVPVADLPPLPADLKP